jgi:hypothetical protein
MQNREFATSKIEKVILKDEYGSKTMVQSIGENSGFERLNCSGLENGLYFMTITNLKGEEQTFKVVVK